ncbi:DsbA family oxidoreductase [Anaerolentibacter hominis]|uniref:DsbA family oxidoreductase n=1 Tax=Anaerolentibacter hominis TaxID=3079009 RepID=UPI0031B81E48
MSKKLNIYYDYICPYCYKGWKELCEIIKDYKDVELNWVPCESHPRPEPASIHSDLAAQAAFYLMELGLDIQRYNALVYAAHFDKRQRIDDIELLADLAAEAGAEKDQVLAVLKNGSFTEKVLAANRLVWGTMGFEAVPSYEWNGKTAGSRGGILVARDQVRKLFQDADSAYGKY